MKERPGTPAFRTLTGTTLLEGLKDPRNQTIWREYVERYRPLVVQVARRVGLGAHDAEDVAQTALLAFAEAYRAGKYDPARGRLRSWLLGIVHNHLKGWLRRRSEREVRPADDSLAGELLAQVEGRERLEEVWDEEWQGAVFARCLEEVRAEVAPDTWRAFELFALGGRSAREAADELGTSAEKVFGAKRRVLRRIREIRPLIEDAL